MKELEELFKNKGIKFDHKDNRIPCYPHIINICVSHIVSSLTKVNAGSLEDDSDDDSLLSEDESDDGGYVGDETDTENDETDEDKYTDLKDWFATLKRDPVRRARVVVRTVRSSGQRKDEFLSMIKTGNKKGSFKDQQGNQVVVKELQLLRDVRHRWSSLYVMLERLQELHPVRPVYLLGVMTDKLNRLLIASLTWTKTFGC